MRYSAHALAEKLSVYHHTGLLPSCGSLLHIFLEP